MTIPVIKLRGAWDVQTKVAPLTSDGSIPRGGREHWLSSDFQLSPMAPRPFLCHVLVIASAGGRNLVRAGTFLTTSSKRLGEEMSAAKLSLGPLKGHDDNTERTEQIRPTARTTVQTLA